MNHARIHGDPFGDSVDASQLRSFLRLAVGSGVRCSLSLSAVQPRRPARGERLIPLTDGVRNWSVPTQLPPAEVELLLRAANDQVRATAPLVVFAADSELTDAARLGGLEWPRAATVIAARHGVTAPELLTRLRAELRWAGTEQPQHALCETDLQPWLSLPAASAGGPIVHVADDEFAGGTGLVVDAFLGHWAETGRRLRLILPAATEQVVTGLRERLGSHAAQVEVRSQAFSPDTLLDAAAIVLPYRQCTNTATLVRALASGRPVCAARFVATAAVLDGRSVVHAIGGRNIIDDADHGAFFAPDPMALVDAVSNALAGDQFPTGQRARDHVIAELTRARPASPPPMVTALHDARPTVVLEAPIFETSSSAELTLATAEALVQRGNVDLRLVPNAPFSHDLGWLRARAPSLESHLCRAPGHVDLWLSSGWPVRAVRPDCRSWALRVDWEYGSLPMDLTPHATEDADVVVVHSEHVERTMNAAGRSSDSIALVPHGVDAAMHEQVEPATEIMSFKNGRPAVMFCGGLVWRKGFDVFLRAVLTARAQGHDFVVVVKSIGGNQHYGKFHLGELLERFHKTAGTPPLLVLDNELSRATLASVYTACDVLLHPYRGEGFCMPVLEARACGLPVVATAGGATDALMTGPGATQIPAERRSVDLPGAHVSVPWVLEPSAQDAAEALSRTLVDLTAQRRAARQIAPSVRQAFSWHAAAESIEQLARGARPQRQLPLVAEPVVALVSDAMAAPPEVALPVGR